MATCNDGLECLCLVLAHDLSEVHVAFARVHHQHFHLFYVFDSRIKRGILRLVDHAKRVMIEKEDARLGKALFQTFCGLALRGGIPREKQDQNQQGSLEYLPGYGPCRFGNMYAIHVTYYCPYSWVLSLYPSYPCSPVFPDRYHSASFQSVKSASDQFHQTRSGP